MSYRPYQAIINEASGNSNRIRSNLRNDSGSTIPKLTPVCLNTSGKLKLIDVAVQNDALKFVGITENDIPNASFGNIVTNGKIENITTSFDFGDYVYVSKAGGLTNILPSEGVDGFVSEDYVLRVGVISQNETNPLNKDLIINMTIVGQV